MKSARSVIPITVNGDIPQARIPELFKPLIAALLATGFFPSAQAIDTVWFGGTGNWELAGNWSVAQPARAMSR